MPRPQARQNLTFTRRKGGDNQSDDFSLRNSHYLQNRNFANIFTFLKSKEKLSQASRTPMFVFTFHG
jgi:hypothetical protein